MKTFLLLCCINVVIGAYAGDGIQFSQLPWKEAQAKAKKDNKLIFIDFYTQWCGPCLLMQKEVFVLPEVADYFNAHFINLKVDAENGEGIEIAKKYGINSYPTYTFVDPSTGSMVHTSRGRQSKEVFLEMAQSALSPAKRSETLIAQYNSGNTDPEFLLQYAQYEASRYNAKMVAAIVEKLVLSPGYSLQNPKIWALFVSYVHNRDDLLAKELISHPEKYIIQYGKEAVDKKMFTLFHYAPDPSILTNAPDFKGKEYLIKKNSADKLITSGNYEAASVIIRDLMDHPGDFTAEICNFLLYLGLTGADIFKINYTVVPDFWKKQCIGYLQFAAYNTPQREDYQAHYYYALAMENLLKTLPESASLLPDDFASPASGQKTYSTRDPQLKEKPVKK